MPAHPIPSGLPRRFARRREGECRYTPLSIERRVFELVFALNPKVKPFVEGE
jgi:hypothetical protein